MNRTPTTRPRSSELEEAGRLLIVGIPGPELDAETRGLLVQIRPGGVILFARNVVDADQLSDLVADLRRTVPRLMVYVDAEGGRVDRFQALFGPAPAGEILAASAPRVAERAGRWIGQSLRVFDCDVDLAPVVDLDLGESGNALDGRYLGSDPKAVVARGRAFLRGLASAGVGGCVKHYPGLGAARADTHDEGAEITLSDQALAASLEPFRQLGQEAGSMMAAHASYPELDPSGRPAGLSKPISLALLRQDLRFRGVLFSDDLDMHALDDQGELPVRAAKALRAGCDGLFVCRSLEAVPEIAARLSRPGFAVRRQEAIRRLLGYRRKIMETRRGARTFSFEIVRARMAELRESLS